MLRQIAIALGKIGAADAVRALLKAVEDDKIITVPWLVNTSPYAAVVLYR